MKNNKKYAIRNIKLFSKIILIRPWIYGHREKSFWFEKCVINMVALDPLCSLARNIKELFFWLSNINIFDTITLNKLEKLTKAIGVPTAELFK